jgi:hypothetical protein
LWHVSVPLMVDTLRLGDSALYRINHDHKPRGRKWTRSAGTCPTMWQSIHNLTGIGTAKLSDCTPHQHTATCSINCSTSRCFTTHSSSRWAAHNWLLHASWGSAQPLYCFLR